jgi:opacity protein-like surface antigen
MSKKLSAVAMGAAVAFMAFAGAVQADTLLGKNYVGGSLSMISFGEDDMDVFDDATGLNGFGNINLNSNIDLQVGASYAWTDGDYMGISLDANTLQAGADLVYFFRPERRCNPYLKAGLAVVKSEVEAALLGVTVSEDDTNVGFGAGGGVEFEATKEILFRAGLNYFNVDSDDSVNLSGKLGYWFNPQILGYVGGSYDFDSEDKVGEIGMVFRIQ